MVYKSKKKNQKKQFVNWGQSFRNPSRWEVLNQSKELGKMKPVHTSSKLFFGTMLLPLLNLSLSLKLC